MLSRRRRTSLLLAALLTVSCAPKPPDLSARPPMVQRAFTAKDVLDQTTVLTETAIMANASGKLSDADTVVVRDISLTVTSAMEAYVPGGTVSGVLTAMRETVSRLSTRLSPDAQVTLGAALRVLQALINGFAPEVPLGV